MKSFPFQAVLFDLDGTLVDSNRDLAPALNHALGLAGRAPLPENAVSRFIGGGAALMLERALAATGGPVAKAEFAPLYDALLAHYLAHIAENTVPYPGILDALDGLAALGVKLAVCTNKAESSARALLDALGMTGRFAAIYGGDTLGRERAKPAPDMLLAAAADCGVNMASGGRAAMVGDSSFDVRAARNAGMPVVVYAGGYLDLPPGEIGADALLDDYAALAATLAAL